MTVAELIIELGKLNQRATVKIGFEETTYWSSWTGSDTTDSETPSFDIENLEQNMDADPAITLRPRKDGD